MEKGSEILEEGGKREHRERERESESEREREKAREGERETRTMTVIPAVCVSTARYMNWKTTNTLWNCTPKLHLRGRPKGRPKRECVQCTAFATHFTKKLFIPVRAGMTRTPKL